MVIKVDINQAPPVVGVERRERQPAVHRRWRRPCGRSASRRRSGPSTTTRLLLKFQRRFANNFSFMNSYTLGKSMDFASDNEAGITQQPTISTTTGGRRTTTCATRSARAGSTRSRGRASSCTADGRSTASCTCAPACRSRSRRRRACARPGTGNRPNRICGGELSNPTVEKWFDTSCFVSPADTTGTYGDTGRNIMRGPGQFNIDASLIKNTQHRPIQHRDPHRGVQRAEPPAVRQPRCRQHRSATGHGGVWPDSADADAVPHARFAARPSGRCRSA